MTGLRRKFMDEKLRIGGWVYGRWKEKIYN